MRLRVFFYYFFSLVKVNGILAVLVDNIVVWFDVTRGCEGAICILICIEDVLRVCDGWFVSWLFSGGIEVGVKGGAFGIEIVEGCCSLILHCNFINNFR